MRSDTTRSMVSRAVVVAAAAAVLLPVRAAEAIPAFARKYQTSCQTCHVAFPKLNPFGEVFRLRGYRMPEETEDMIKEQPVQLGAPAYKRVWPDAVWPSDVPGTIPLSLNTVFSDVTQRTLVPSHSEESTIKNDFRFPEEVGLLTGGTLGETLSFFGELAFEPGVHDGGEEIEVELEHSQLNFNGPFGSGLRFNLKVGRFAPEITQPLSHGAVLTTGGPTALLQYVPIAAHGGSEIGGHGHGAAGIALPHSVDGIEAYGILGQRFLYSGGLANGLGPGEESFDGNNAKDVYGRVAVKIGGLPLDGADYEASDKNWREKSLRIGVFGYRGDGTGTRVGGTGHHADELLEDREFTRVGVDVNAYFQDLNFLAGFVRGRDALATYEVMAGHGHDEGEEGDEHGEGEEAGEAEFVAEAGYTYRAWFAEADYVFMPWLHGAMRYEWLDPANSRAPTLERIVPNLTALVRANVKAYVEYQRDVGAGDNYLLLGGLQFAF